MADLFNVILTQPLFNLLVFFYNILPIQDVGLAIIALTILIKLALFPLSYKALQSQKELQGLQPEIKRLQEKYKDNKEKQARAIMELYKARGINPMGGCLPILIQLPILLALFNLFRQFEQIDLATTLYPFINNPGSLSPIFLGMINLDVPSVGLAALAGAFQFLQAKLALGSQLKGTMEGKKAAALSQLMGQQMVYVMPVFVFIIALSLPAALSLYWAVNALFTAGQELYLLKRK